MDDKNIKDVGGIFLRLIIAHRKLSRRFIKPAGDSVLSDDLAPHHGMIMKILHDHGLLHVAEIGAITGISRSQMTASIDKLLALGLIERHLDTDDRRRFNIELTPEGRTLIDNIDKAIYEHVGGAFQALGKDKQDQFVDALATLEALLTELVD
jgi:MarR family transcriptional regulator for hemolysin